MAYPQQPVQPKASNGMATTSLVLAIIGWVVPAESYRDGISGLYYAPFSLLIAIVMPILAVIFGHLGLIRAGNGARGRGPSIAGLILGYLMLTFEIVGVIVAAAH